MNNEANWPIRVGGEYAPNNKLGAESWLGCRVTAIEGDEVYYILRTKHSDGEIAEHAPTSTSVHLFRLCYFPEDQSPIPALIEALEDLLAAIPKQTEDADWWPDELTHAVRDALCLLANVAHDRDEVTA